MKRVIRASSKWDREPITKLTEDEILRLPDKVLVVTRTPGSSTYSPVFKIVTKDALSDPDKCVFISSYWGYAFGTDVYLADKAEVDEYYNDIIEKLQEERDKYRRYAF